MGDLKTEEELIQEMESILNLANCGAATREEHKAVHPRNQGQMKYHLEESLKYQRLTEEHAKREESGRQKDVLSQLRNLLQEREVFQDQNEDKQMPDHHSNSEELQLNHGGVANKEEHKAAHPRNKGQMKYLPEFETDVLAQLMGRLEKLEEQQHLPSVPEPQEPPSQLDDIFEEIERNEEEEATLAKDHQHLEDNPEELEALVYGELKMLAREIFKIETSVYTLCMQSRALAKTRGQHEPDKDVLDKQVPLEVAFLAKSLVQATDSIYKKLQ